MLRTTSTLGAALILSVLGAAGACSSSKTPAHATRTVTPTLQVLGKLHAQIAGDLVLGVQGSYYGCSDQSDGSSWVLDAPGAPPAYMENQTGLQLPAVQLNDSNCSLQIDDIVTDTDTYVSSEQPEPLYITGPNAIAGEYQEGSIGFDDPAQSDELAFYANAESDFVQAEASFTLIVGDDPDIGTPSTTAEAGALPIPQTCADVLAGEPAAPDGNYTLYAGGSPGSPWIAYCYGMQGGNDGGAPLTYLTLGTGLQNFSQYTAGGDASPGTNVITTYTRVLIDPVAMVIHGGDQRFASSTGSLTDDVADTTVTSMPYGVAMSCDGTPNGTGSVDLSGTNFAPGSFYLGGTAPYGGATEVTAFDYTLQGGGSCGWITGQASAFNPFNTTDVTLNVIYLGD